MTNIKSPKKLIEVALPLDDINAACAREKSIRHGHPSTLHLWWARRPLAAARAVIFAQMVNDPGGERGWKTGLTKAQAQLKREELFDIIRDLVKWENTNNEEVLERAREKIRESWRETCRLNAGKPGFNPEELPAFHDPFAGGGALPLEAQRLGLESYASDLNPVAVTICKAMIEIPPKFAERPPIGPIPRGESFQPPLGGKWSGATGLAEDVRRYGAWMREEARKKIGHLYPPVEITAEMAAERPDLEPYVGRKLPVIAWLWARTVKSPHPQFSDVDVPLISSFLLSTKKGKEAWVEPVVEGNSYRFVVRTGKPPQGAENGTKAPGRSANFFCLMSNSVVDGKYVKGEGQAGRMGARLMAMVCLGDKGRVYISPQESHAEIAMSAKPEWRPEGMVPRHLTGGTCVPYGLNTWDKLFTNRQLVALNTFSDLIQDARAKVLADAKNAGMFDDGVRLEAGGKGATAYADAVSVYLAFAVDRATDAWSSLASWTPQRETLRTTFGRQALPMVWDFTEVNPFSEQTGNFKKCCGWIVKALESFSTNTRGVAEQADAQRQEISTSKLVSTDPPYYDNIGYADLSDFFYIWMRRGLRDVFPKTFVTMATPKDEELVATPYRHGGKDEAEKFFMDGMTIAMHNLCMQSHSAFPVTIYYAFKQSVTDSSGTGNAGWESFLEAVIIAGFSITGTWPMRTEREGRAIGIGANALASSIVLVCRKRDEDAPQIGRRDFLRELREAMPEALRAMQGLDGDASPVAPVDLAQAAIGPGMEIYSKYKAVLNADGTRMGVHDAIVEINKFLDNGDDFDPATQFCRDWFSGHAWGDGQSGEADVLARAKGVALPQIVDAGVIESRAGKTHLLNWTDYPEDYDPGADKNRPVWEVCHHLVRIHQRHGTGVAGAFLASVQSQGESARQLAYVLYTICERKGMADDARCYNELVVAWNDILRASFEHTPPAKLRQGELEI